jgi:hypothetical protein
MSEYKDDKELMDAVNSIRSRFKTEFEDTDKQQLSFIDELNELIRKIFKDDPTDVYTTLSPGELENWKKKRWKRWFIKKISKINIRVILYFLLLSTITAFLISEAVSFYAIESTIAVKSWIKAILTEMCFIFLSGYRAVGFIESAFVGILRVSIFCLMLFVITSDLAFNSVSTTAVSDNIAQQIVLVEKQIEDIQKTIEFYKSKNWGTSVNKYELDKKALVNKLIALKEKQGEGKTESVSKVVEYQAWGRGVFRVILMLISVLITRRLFKF